MWFDYGMSLNMRQAIILTPGGALTHLGRDKLATIYWLHFQMQFCEWKLLFLIDISLKFST